MSLWSRFRGWFSRPSPSEPVVITKERQIALWSYHHCERQNAFWSDPLDICPLQGACPGCREKAIRAYEEHRKGFPC